MSQEYNNSSRRSRRTGRSTRNQPVLVTATADEQNEESVQDNQEEVSTTVAEPIPITPTPKETRTRRFPSFFSTVGKSEEDEASKDADVAQARITRATHGKKGTISTKDAPAKDTPKAETKPERATTKPTRPPSTFKTRYILGMAIYLLTAQFIGAYEQQFIRSIGAERQLTQFNLFGAPIVIETSTLVFLATLVIILVLLARFDLIPRNLGAISGTPARGQTQNKTSQDGAEKSKQLPPPMKQGVKGADDKLYEEYRINQRRGKKR